VVTETAAIPAQVHESETFSLVPVFSLWQREVVRFYRNLSRVVGVIASPLLFWLVLGSGFGTSFRNGESGQHYLEFFFPGALIMIVLFTSIFAMMSLIEDRNQGFLLSVLVAPVHRSVIVLGKVLGGTTLATLQGLLFLVFAPLVGVHIGIAQLLLVALDIFLVAFSLTALGFAIAWPSKADAPIPCHVCGVSGLFKASVGLSGVRPVASRATRSENCRGGSERYVTLSLFNGPVTLMVTSTPRALVSRLRSSTGSSLTGLKNEMAPSLMVYVLPKKFRLP